MSDIRFNHPVFGITHAAPETGSAMPLPGARAGT